MTDRSTSVNHFLEPLQPFLDTPEITEIVVNRSGQVYFETRAGWQSEAVPALTYDHLIKLGVAVAKFAGENVLFQSTVPILSAVLPGGERSQFVMPPACKAGTVSLTIRKPSFDVRTLDTYIADSFFDRIQAANNLNTADGELLELYKHIHDMPRANERRASFLKRCVELGIVVLDIKGENFDITSGFRAKHGQKVYLFAPFDENGVTHRYNPLEYISDDPAQRLSDIDAIGTALYSGGTQNDKFWSENAKDLFRGLCLFVLERNDLPKTFGEILRQASGKGKPLKEYIYEELKKAQDEGRPFSNACIDCLNRVLSNSENTLAGIVATFGTPLLIFQNPRVDLATSANDFDLREVRRERMSIYFKVPPNKLKEGSVLVNLFFDQLLNLNTRVLPSQDKTLKHQCLVLLDEMTSIGRVAMIAQAVSYMAGYNMRLLTIIQNKSQLEDAYGKAGALTLLSNHALMVMYAPSPTVQSDAQEYSEMLGYETVKSRSRTASMNSSSTSTSDQRRALMLPQEIRELGQTREIVSLENCKPILCDKIRYYEDPDFTSRANLPPPTIPKQDIDTFIAKIENRTRSISIDEIGNPAETAGKIVLDNFQELPQSATTWGQEEVESFVDFDVQAALSTLTFAHPKKDAVNPAIDGITDQETKEAFIADIFDVTDTPSVPSAASATEEISNLARSLAPSEANNDLDTKTTDIAETLQNIDALISSSDPNNKDGSPVEKFYSKINVRDRRRIGVE